MLEKSFGVLQKVGKALMLPVALLPAAGILLAFGNVLQNPAALALIPMLGHPAVQALAKVMEQAGGVIFSNLALLFAVGVAVGLAAGEGVAGLAAIVGFLIMNMTMGMVAGVTPEMLASKNPAYVSVLGIPTLQTGVFGGIITGVFAAAIYKRYFTMELPSYLSFFAGKRFVPIMTAAGALVLGVVMVFIWPPIQSALNFFSHNMIDANRTLAAFVFGVAERSLIPFGLHHIFYNPFWYQFGEYVNKAGQVINGDQSIFFAQLKDGVPFTAGTFMAGKFPFMMFGLPAAALAIYHEARPEKKQITAGIMASAALTSFLTGITEPIEFSFLFVAPLLFGIHCFFAGLSFMAMDLLNVKIGMTFSGGVIDFILFGVIPHRTAWWLVIPLGLCFSVIYYFGFRFAIRHWNLKTPGREIESEPSNVSRAFPGDLAEEILDALGGAGNITALDACITRLRVSVSRIEAVNQSRLKSLGASGVMVVGNNLQAVFGPKSDQLKSQIQTIIDKAEKNAANESIVDEPMSVSGESEIDKDEGIDNMFDNFVAPITGRLISLSDVPDAVFAQKIMGDGFAIDPSEGEIVSPVNGTVTSFMSDTRHAVGITSEHGLEILVHIGIDTVKLSGEGFRAFVKQDDVVRAGQPLLEVNLDLIRSKVPSLISPIVFTNLPEGRMVSVEAGRRIQRGEKNVFKVR